MKLLQKIVGFEWDKGNSQKSYFKHGVDRNQAERVFVDYWLLVTPKKQTTDEERYIARGEVDGRLLFVVFTVRGKYIRIISARVANRKERDEYYNQA